MVYTAFIWPIDFIEIPTQIKPVFIILDILLSLIDCLLDTNPLFVCTSAMNMAKSWLVLLSLLHMKGLMSFELAKHVKSTVHGFCGFVNIYFNIDYM